MILPIVTEPNPILRQRAQEVNPEKIKSLEIQRLILDMKETVRPAGGIGLAAPQVGLSLRLIVVAMPGKDLMALINPQIMKFSLRKQIGEEGCLSVPGKFGLVKRTKMIRVRALDESGRSIKFKAKDLFARVIQHEIDHLNGTLFTDKATKVFSDQKL